MEKSEKYPGVYWRMVEKPSGQGRERMYYIVYRRGGRGSKLIKEPVGTTGQDITEAKANQIRALRISGKELSNKEAREERQKEKIVKGLPATFGELWNKYRETLLGKSGLRADDNRYKKHIAKRLGNKAITDIETSDLEAIRKGIEKKNLSPQSVKHALALIRRVLRYGDKMNLCKLPEKLVFNMPKVDNEKTEVMTDNQLRAYLKALDEEPEQDKAALLRIALITGIRKGALLALQWSDIDFERELITLRGESAKNGKTEFIPLIDEAKAVFKSIPKTSDFIWPGRDGGKREDFRRMARRVKEKAGLPKDFRPLHGLRHNFASCLVNSGVDLYTVQNLLTHGSMAMTQRYAHLRDEKLRKAANEANPLAGIKRKKEEE